MLGELSSRSALVFRHFQIKTIFFDWEISADFRKGTLVAFVSCQHKVLDRNKSANGLVSYGGDFMLTVRKAREADRRVLVSCLLEAFESDFSPFLKQFGEDFVVQFMEKVMVLDRFYIGEVDGELVGTLALTSANHRAVSVDRKELRKSFGRLKTFFLALAFKEFEEVLPFPETTGFFEFVAVKKSFRRQGIASQMMSRAMKITSYKDYVLDVKDSNASAISCYQKLGFKEFARKPKPRFTQQKDFKELILMEYLSSAGARADEV